MKCRDLGTSRDKRSVLHSERPPLPKQMRYQTALHAVCLRYSNLTSIPAVNRITQNYPKLPRGISPFLVQIRDKHLKTADAVQKTGAAVVGAPSGGGASLHATTALIECALFYIDLQSQNLNGVPRDRAP